MTSRRKAKRGVGQPSRPWYWLDRRARRYQRCRAHGYTSLIYFTLIQPEALGDYFRRHPLVLAHKARCGRKRR